MQGYFIGYNCVFTLPENETETETNNKYPEYQWESVLSSVSVQCEYLHIILCNPLFSVSVSLLPPTSEGCWQVLFSVCQFTPRQGGYPLTRSGQEGVGVYPLPRSGRGLPPSLGRGTPHLNLGRGTPIQTWEGGTSLSRPGKSVPPYRPGNGVPPSRPGEGAPPPPTLADGSNPPPPPVLTWDLDRGRTPTGTA